MNNCVRCLKDIDYCEECTYNNEMYDDGYNYRRLVKFPLQDDWPDEDYDSYAED